ncbi:hypothetical protein PI125_g3572 [Phytophthora idaei]|nr:hypothetical protein PI125_g3572 [Phytophthora idaei]
MVMRRSPSSSPRSQRARCVNPVFMYLGIALYVGCLLFWWLFLKGDANRVRISRWSSAIYSKSTVEPELGSNTADTLLKTFARGIGATTPELLELNKKHHIPDYKEDQYCGMTMVQHDTRGEVIFLHRNGKKLSGEEDFTRDHTWGQLQTFIFPEHLVSVDADPVERYEFVKKFYKVNIFKGGKEFVKTRMCYGDRYMESKHFRLTPWEELPYHSLEDTLLDYARDASQL